MKKIFVSLTIVLAFFSFNIIPVSAVTVGELEAQIKELLAKVSLLTKQLNELRGQSTNPSPIVVKPESSQHRICLVLYRNLEQGTRGDDVQALQEFLKEEKILTVEPTGYFGMMTSEALKRWQTTQGVDSVGMMGPMTREKIKTRCGNIEPDPVACTLEYKPVCGQPVGCDNVCPIGQYCTMMCKQPAPKTYSNRCEMNANKATLLYEGACQTTTSNKPPVISSFSGPTVLNVNSSGEWKVLAKDPESGALSYSIWWGDENIYVNNMMSAASSREFVQNTSFTHTYAQSGVYTVAVVVRDNLGLEAKTTMTVKVE